MKKTLIALIISLAGSHLFSQSMVFTSQNEMAILPSLESLPAPVAFGILSTNGLEIDEVFNVGITTGLKFFTVQSLSGSYPYPYIPLALDLRFQLGKKKHIPLIYGRAGYAITTTTSLPSDFPVFDRIWGGLTFGTGIGYRYLMSEKLGIQVGLGYSTQQTHFKDSGADITISGYGNTLLISAGIVFRNAN